MDSTLFEAAAGLENLKPRDADPPLDDGDRGNASVDFHGDRRADATHQSTTGPDAGVEGWWMRECWNVSRRSSLTVRPSSSTTCLSCSSISGGREKNARYPEAMLSKKALAASSGPSTMAALTRLSKMPSPNPRWPYRPIWDSSLNRSCLRG